MKQGRIFFVGYFLGIKNKMTFTNLFDNQKKRYLESSFVANKNEDYTYFPEKLYLIHGKYKFTILGKRVVVDSCFKEMYRRDLKDYRSSMNDDFLITKIQKIKMLFIYFILIADTSFDMLFKTKSKFNIYAWYLFFQKTVNKTIAIYHGMNRNNQIAEHYFFKFKFLSGYKYFEKITKKLLIEKDDIFILWGKEYSSRLFLIDLLEKKSIKYYIAEYGELPGTISCNKKGIFGESFPALHWDEFSAKEVSSEELENAKELISQIKKNQISVRGFGNNMLFLMKYFYQNSLQQPEENREKIIYVNGTELFASGLYFNKYGIEFNGKNPNKYLLEKVVDYYKDSNYMIIYKDHPMTKKLNPRACITSRDFPSVNVVEDVNIHDLLELADLVISFPSKVVMTSLIYEKRTFVLGDFSIPKSIASLNYYTSRTFDDIRSMDNQIVYDDEAFVSFIARLLKYQLLIYDKVLYKNSRIDNEKKLKDLLEN